jgi:hypothetical protein
MAPAVPSGPEAPLEADQHGTAAGETSTVDVLGG